MKVSTNTYGHSESKRWTINASVNSHSERQSNLKKNQIITHTHTYALILTHVNTDTQTVSTQSITPKIQGPIQFIIYY
jgi:hypothetical protein